MWTVLSAAAPADSRSAAAPADSPSAAAPAESVVDLAPPGSPWLTLPVAVPTDRSAALPSAPGPSSDPTPSGPDRAGLPARGLRPQPGRDDDPAPSPVGGQAAGPARGRPGEEPVEDQPEAPAPPPRAPRPGGAGAFDPGLRGVKVLGALAVAVLLVAGFFAWQARPRTEPAGAAGPSAGAPEHAADASASPPAEVVVSVAGKVRRPGLVRLATGARLSDAVQAAGGAEDGVDVAMLNPARKVADGELIVVGVEPPPGTVAGPVTGPAATGGRVNLNTATVAQLDALPGVGPVLAQRIVDHRDKQGPFRSVADLRKVNGIGDSRFEDLKDLVSS